jgi:anti-sigma-K factor RskA
MTYSGIAAAVGAIIAGVVVNQAQQRKIDTLVGVRDILLAERMQMVSLAEPDQKGPATGRVYWDVDRGRWGVVVFNLKPPPPGKVYQLWAIPGGAAPIPMDTFTVDSVGKAMFMQTVPTATAAIKVAAITMEPVGGSQVPTMPIQLMGQAN